MKGELSVVKQLVMSPSYPGLEFVLLWLELSAVLFWLAPPGGKESRIGGKIVTSGGAGGGSADIALYHSCGRMTDLEPSARGRLNRGLSSAAPYCHSLFSQHPVNYSSVSLRAFHFCVHRLYPDISYIIQ